MGLNEGLKSFSVGDVVVARDEFLDFGETVERTAGVVLEYSPANDRLVIGSLRPERWAIPPRSAMRGACYRLATAEEAVRATGRSR